MSKDGPSDRKTSARSVGLERRTGRRSRSASQRANAQPAGKGGKTPPAPARVQQRLASRLARARALPIAALIAFATLPYLNILYNGFVYDDDNQLVLNPYVRSFHYLKEIFTTNVWSFRGVTAITNYYRPMMTLGYLVGYKLFGLRPYGFHLISLLLHAAVVCLIFVLTQRLTGDRVWAFVAAAWFALHPIHTESVAWIAAVTDLEVTVFYLITFGLFLALPGPAGGRSERLLALMGGTFLLALLSKEQAMTLPALATVYEHFYREDRSETSLAQKLTRYGVLWLVGVVYVLFRLHFFGALAPAQNLPGLTPFRVLLSAVALVGQYAWKLLWPVRLCAFYVFHPSRSLLDPRFLAGLLVILAFTALFFVCWRSRERDVRFLSFAILWFFATLAPVLDAHWVGANVFTERYLYLPSVGIAWLIGLGAAKLWRRAGRPPALRRALVLAGVTLGLLFAARIVIRDRDWNNDIVFYTRTLDVSPDSYLFQNNLGTVYWHAHEVDKAASLWQRALALNVDNPDVLNNLGLVAFERHQYAEAAGYFERASRLRPSLPDPHLNLGKAYMKLGQPGSAEPQLRAAVALAPLNSSVHDELGKLLAETGRPEEAEEQFRASVHIEPSIFAYDYLGMLEVRRHAPEAAERDFRAALGLDETDSNAHFGLGFLYKSAGRTADALAQYQAGLARDPANAQALAAVRQLRQQSPGAMP